jgi:hypothetical protein
VASASLPKDKRSAGIAIVEQHIRFENEHDLEGVLGTFCNNARYAVTDDAIVVEVIICGTHLGDGAPNRVPTLRCVYLRRS